MARDNELYTSWTHWSPNILRKSQFRVHNLFAKFVRVAVEGVCPRKSWLNKFLQVIHDDSNTPDIDLIVVLYSFPDLGSHIHWSSAIGGQHLVRNNFADSKICEFQYSIRLTAGQKQVLGL